MIEICKRKGKQKEVLSLYFDNNPVLTITRPEKDITPLAHTPLKMNAEKWNVNLPVFLEGMRQIWDKLTLP
ncbi:hypothetical protein HWN40_06265 [Methanolobus zinderi]|uniref:Uncharacterized protein n=1 Tax=Methanolobus zinderi TaxID=536044 RepID=A0A7D5E7V2_9EURY|nr:hypothetical protein [Methanolobus zinderi]QLC49879.1 hypothetical protein HWN40_06265 [Methanolobus zinderi]